MKGEWCIFNSYFTPAQCDEIVTMANKLDKRDASMGVGGETNTEEYRRSKIAFIQKDMPQFKALFDKLWELSCWANNDWLNLTIYSLLNILRLRIVNIRQIVMYFG